MTADNPSLTPEQQHDCERLLSKSQEAFILAIELFNRPTIRYRVEGCAFFLCNAWELMLKAYLIKRDGYESIFYPGKTQRTLSLADCIKKVMTNDKDPVRLNLESIDELRNTGTHFVVEEYEITYGPIFQANIHNYDDKLRDWHSIEICDSIPDNYLVLSVNRTDLDGETLRAKYTPEVAARLLRMQTSIDQTAEVENNIKYSAYFHTEFVLSKKHGIPIQVDNNADTHARIIKQLINPTDKYPYSMKKLIELVNRKLKHRSISFVYNNDQNAKFSRYHFRLFIACYDMKQEKKYCYDRSSPEERKNGRHSYIYSDQAVEFIVDEIAKDPQHIIQKLKNKTTRMEKLYKANPRGKGILDLKSYSHSGTQPLSTQVGLVGTNLHYPYVNCRKSTEKHSVSGLIKHVNNRGASLSVGGIQHASIPGPAKNNRRMDCAVHSTRQATRHSITI